MKKIAILGSTGSIGTQTLEVVRANGDIEVTALSAGKNIRLLAQQIREFRPRIAAVWEEADAKELRLLVADLPVTVVSGMEGLKEVAVCEETQVLVTAIVGMIGIVPTIEAIKAGKDIALANKETLVTAGHIIMPLAKEHGVRILPVDSEHSAIFQALNGEDGRAIDKILLTASGGPFRGRTYCELEKVRVEDALKHPNWAMGQKITIDSASMVNKGLEVMEARWLFGTDLDQIQVVIQPQSIIHSMVQFADGAVIAQLGTPDMKLPIQYALYYPQRRFLAGERLDFAKIGSITFEDPDLDTFLGLKYAFEAARTGGSMPTVFNAANERAVSKFLNRQIGFTDIYEIIRFCMDEHQVIASPDVDQILNTEQAVYDIIESRW
ncbi:1-deoxy-D-xylulose-5-phosphate reductoisomerase [Parablautia sp. Marseille-Q6255]|uniref:1-deoxy-D-xylulose-5-phosphate reductoisomerase n=1 Tax=Parablautia sp. Marseille-Q6255 TaxID=3039593 RepID=UPI0024BD2AC7|nr:1-deoxy-D-xylulose-5-phosphate reductoisomerase [Parablautia sp. Marseille-Q6255]